MEASGTGERILWRRLVYGVAVAAGMAAAGLSMQIPWAVPCLCCGPIGGAAAGFAACAAPPAARAREAARIGLTGGAFYGLGSVLGLWAGAIIFQFILSGLMISLAGPAAAGASARSALWTAALALLWSPPLLAVGAGAGWLGGLLHLAMRREAEPADPSRIFPFSIRRSPWSWR